MSQPPPYPYTPPSIPYATPVPDVDNEHLRLLAIFHWIVGPIQLLMGCFPIIHLVVGLALVSGSFPAAPGSATSHPPPPVFVGWLFVILASVFILIGWGFGILTLISGFQIRDRRRRVFSIVVAGLNCIHFPFGTTLGVFTLIVLLRRSVEALYRSTAVSESHVAP